MANHTRPRAEHAAKHPQEDPGRVECDDAGVA
jgi:hypothetical protein